jgi:hypothetical protein
MTVPLLMIGKNQGVNAIYLGCGYRRLGLALCLQYGQSDMALSNRVCGAG